MDFSNQLSDAEIERLALLSEECAEVIQVIGKIQRHGYESVNPILTNPKPTNREMLEHELGHVKASILLMHRAHDIDRVNIASERDDKLVSVRRWLHHQPDQLFKGDV